MHVEFLDKLKGACQPRKKSVGISISNCFICDVSDRNIKLSLLIQYLLET